jgi:hypothetical protein
MLELVPWSDYARVEALLAGAGHAEGLPGWYDALAASTLAPGETAMVARHRRAALPVAIGPEGLRALTAPYTTRYVPVLPDVGSAYELGRRLRTVAGGVVRLEALDPSDPGMAALLQGLGAGLTVATFDKFANWSEAVSSFERYWQARPSRLKATVRRKAAVAEARFTYVGSGFDAALAAYEDIQRASWKGPEPHPDFLATMVQRMSAQVRMGLLAIGGRTVAAQIWLVWGGRATIFKLVHREDAAALSPGTLLTVRMIETCLGEEGVSVLDFGRGDDAYKRDWMATRVMRLGVIAGDWRYGKGLRVIASEVLPTLAGRAWRRHFQRNRPGSPASRDDEALESVKDRGIVNAAEAS